jgi:hypothetical protein
MTNLSSLEPVLIGLLIAGLVIVRQFGARRVASVWTVLVPLGLAYFGATGLGTLDTTGFVLLAVSTSLGLGLGVMRATTFRLWTDASGQAVMQGTRMTVLLWVVTIGVKVGLSVLEHQVGLNQAVSGGAELLIPVAATLAAQNVVVYLRSKRRQLVAA